MEKEDELIITRIINSPRELVWKVWTDSKHLAKWWGPHKFTNPVCDIEVKPGGAILIHMQSPDGTIFPMSGKYQEVLKPERLVFISSALDGAGKPLFEQITKIQFTEEGKKTKLTIEVSVSKVTPEAIPYLAGMNEGWKQTIDKLLEYLTKS